MDPFNLFSVELVLLILSFVTDFVGLQSLLSSSPWVRRVFDSRPRQIIINLVRLNPITAIPEIQAQLWRRALIDSPSVNCKGLNSFLRMYPDTRTSPYLHPIAKADTLPGEIHDDQIFCVIDVAANIQRLACMCLHAMHRDFVSAIGDAFGPSTAQRAAEPIIWLEEYRVYWALWQLENYAALSKVARSRWEWSKTSLRRLDDAANIDDDITPLAGNICTVATVIESLGLRCFSGFMPSTMYLGHVVSGALRPAHGQSSDISLDSFPFFPSLELLPLGLSSTFPGHQGVYPVWSPPELPNGKSPVEVDWLQIPRYRSILSPAATMYQRHCEMVLALRRFRRSKDLGQAQPYRLIGAFLWNFWRMYSVGLFKHSKGLCQPLPFRLTGVLIWNMWRMYSVGLDTVGFEGRKSTSIGQPDSLGSGPATLRPPWYGRGKNPLPAILVPSGKNHRYPTRLEQKAATSWSSLESRRQCKMRLISLTSPLQMLGFTLRS